MDRLAGALCELWLPTRMTMAPHRSMLSRRMVFLAILGSAACGGESPTDSSPPSTSLLIVSGDGQQAIVGHELPAPLVVQVLDAKGRPVKGQIVNFRVVAGGGSVYAGSSLTNATGNAQDYWTMGPEPGPATLEVRAVDPTTGAKEIFATFSATAVLETFTLTVSTGLGGHVVSDPQGIDCGSDCSERYDKGTVVTLNPIPDPGFQFGSWSGACSGGTCTLTMDGDKSVSAVFVPVYTLSLTVTGPGFILVDALGIGKFTCGPSTVGVTIPCLPFIIVGGSLVTLTTTTDPAVPGAVFDGWTGDCTGTASCVFVMNSNVSVGASFSVPTASNGRH